MQHNFQSKLEASAAATVNRLKAILGGPAKSSRSPFANNSSDDLHISVADFKHHTKYFKAAETAPVHPRAPRAPSPIDVVRLGAEPAEYLNIFGPDSYWYGKIQQFKQQLLSKSATA